MERLKWNFGVINLLIETSRGCELTIHIVLPSLSLKQQVHPVRQLYDCGLPVWTKFRHYKVQFSVTLPPACFLCPPSNTAHRWGAGEGSGESHRSAGASACGLKEPAAMSWCQPPSDRHKGKKWELNEVENVLPVLGLLSIQTFWCWRFSFCRWNCCLGSKIVYFMSNV